MQFVKELAKLFRSKSFKTACYAAGMGLRDPAAKRTVLNSIGHLYGTSSTRKIVPTMIVAAFAGLALIILMLLKSGMGNQAGNEHAGTVKGATPSVAQVPDWTIFDDAFANKPTRLATSQFVDRVRTSGAALARTRRNVWASDEGTGASATSGVLRKVADKNEYVPLFLRLCR